MSETHSEDDLKAFLSKLDGALQSWESFRRAGLEAADRVLNSEMDEVVVRENRTVTIKSEPSYLNAHQMDTLSFMQQAEQDAETLAEMQKEVEGISQNFKKLGNEAFRQKDYGKALNFYSKAIDYVQDSPNLYNNRVLCYMKLQFYKRAILECDFVLNTIDRTNLRAWLYRSMAYYRIGAHNMFESCVKMTKRYNPKEAGFIDKFIKDFIYLQ